MQASMFIYHLFDVADEINLDLVEALWTGRNKPASRLRLERISADSITFRNPPLLVELGFHELTFNGEKYLAEVKARIIDLGVISLIMKLEIPEDISYEQYLDLAIAVDQMPEDILKEYLSQVLDIIRPACLKERVSAFNEDFVVYYFQDALPDWDWVPILLKDKTPVNKETQAETLANRFSYADDITYLAWDSAVVYDNTGSLDIPNLLEFANAQFLELRYYDEALNNTIDQAYEEIDAAKKNNSGLMKTYTSVRNNIISMMTEMSDLTDNIDNSLLVTEDIFYSHVYSRYMQLLRATNWRQNINEKLQVMQRTYTLLNEEVTTRRYTEMAYLALLLLFLMLLLQAYHVLA